MGGGHYLYTNAGRIHISLSHNWLAPRKVIDWEISNTFGYRLLSEVSASGVYTLWTPGNYQYWSGLPLPVYVKVCTVQDAGSTMWLSNVSGGRSNIGISTWNIIRSQWRFREELVNLYWDILQIDRIVHCLEQDPKRCLQNEWIRRRKGAASPSKWGEWWVWNGITSRTKNWRSVVEEIGSPQDSSEAIVLWQLLLSNLWDSRGFLC